LAQLGGSFRHASKAGKIELSCPKDEGPESQEVTRDRRKGQMNSESPETGPAAAGEEAGIRRVSAPLRFPCEWTP